MGLRAEDRTPVRTCVGCRTRKPKRELYRMALGKGDRVIWDTGGTASGRGAYVCPSRDCLAAALQKGRLGRAFRKAVAADGLQEAATPWEK